MKKIISIITILFFVSTSYSQKIDLPKNFEATLKTNFEKRKKNWDGDFELYKKIQIEAFQQKALAKSATSSLSSNDCGDAGFESGILNPADWGGFYKKFTESYFDCSNASTNNINTAAWTSGLIDLAPTTCEYPSWSVDQMTYCGIPSTCSSTLESSLSHFYITAVGNDPIVGALLPKVRPSSGNTKSLRLGNAFPWNGTEKLTKTFAVNSTNQIFSFWYALVMGKPSDHNNNQLPTFIVQVIENATSGNILHNDLVNLSSSLNYISSNDPLLLSTSAYINPCSMTGAREAMVYKPWSFQSINLSTLIGKTITIEIITRDCAPSGHYSYAYLDDFCAQPDATNPSGFAALSKSDTCGLPGKICIDYTLPKVTSSAGVVTTGDVKFTLNFLQNGLPVSTAITSPVLTSGTNYCFNLPATLSGISSTIGFDYYIKAEYTLSTISLPAQIIGSTVEGVKTGQNNDYKINCPNPCTCGQWGSIGYSINGIKNKFLCSNGTAVQLEANQGQLFILNPQYYCAGGTASQPCAATFKYDVYYSKGGASLNLNSIADLKLDSCGIMLIVMKPTCAGVACPPCEFTINVNCCNCQQNISPILFWETSTGNDSLALECGKTFSNKLDCFKTYIIKVKNPCGITCAPDEVITTITYPNGTIATSSSVVGVPLSIATLTGNYAVSIKVKCHGIWCNECKFTFNQTKTCQPVCDNCAESKPQALFVKDNSTVTVKTFPAASTLNAGILLGSVADTYTQIRVNVVDVQISSDNPACLQCYNNPNQWGSILAGNLAIAGFTAASTTYGTIPTTSGYNNSREIIFNAAVPTAVPMGTDLNLNISVPGVNPISCCCIKIKIFLKVTYRNNKCEECSKVIRIDFTECPPTQPGGTGGTVTFIDPTNTGWPQRMIAAPNKDASNPVNFSSGSVNKNNN
jgi:hypothetical protein